MQYSHSRVDCHNSCPYKYQLRYKDKLKTIPAYEPNNALICGNAMHQGAETNLEDALEFYHSNYPIITDKHVDEIIKFEHLIPKIHEILDGVNVYKKEFRINTSRFIGIVDLITENEDGTVDVFDYKYSNAIEKYIESPQLHIYKYFLEQIGFKVRKLGFIFIPKVSIRQKNEESLYQFRRRLQEDLKVSKIQIAEVIYDASKVIEFMDDIVKINEATDYKRNPTKLCDWCDYKKLCLEENDVYMKLPVNKRREKQVDENPDLWIYAQSYVGKSTLIDKYEDLLFLNTDGNTDNTTAPVIPIVDEITVTGRITNRKFAWEVFKETISELEKKDNDFKRVGLDLVEDLYEHCRLYMYDKNGWQHESDGGFGKGWDMIKTEFLSNIKRLKALGYQIIYISKEVATEVTLKNGTKYTTYAPNINAKVANVLAGTVDLTIRAYVDGDKRYIQLAKDENAFGGGRFNFVEKKCELTMDSFKKALLDAQKEVGHTVSKTEAASRNSNNSDEVEVKEEKQGRKSRKSEDKSNAPDLAVEVRSDKSEGTEVVELKPSRRSKKSDEGLVSSEEEVVEKYSDDLTEDTTPVTEPTESAKTDVKEEKAPRTRRSKKDDISDTNNESTTDVKDEETTPDTTENTEPTTRRSRRSSR